jgi:metal-responsive CopG/Arc/MetJ family transcriptional regulator
MAENVTRTTISLPHDLTEKAEPRWVKLGYKSFSEYVAFLIRSDIQQRAVHMVTREENWVTYGKIKPDPQKKYGESKL